MNFCSTEELTTVIQYLSSDIYFPQTASEIAFMSGVSRMKISKILTYLCCKGYLKRELVEDDENGHIKIYEVIKPMYPLVIELIQKG